MNITHNTYASSCCFDTLCFSRRISFITNLNTNTFTGNYTRFCSNAFVEFISLISFINMYSCASISCDIWHTNTFYVGRISFYMSDLYNRRIITSTRTFIHLFVWCWNRYCRDSITFCGMYRFGWKSCAIICGDVLNTDTCTIWYNVSYIDGCS